MGDEDKRKKEPGVAEIVPVRTDGTKPGERLNLPTPKQNTLPMEPARKKRTEIV